MTDPIISNVDEIAILTRAGNTPQVLEHGKHYVVVDAIGNVREFNLTGDAFRDFPAHIKQRVLLTHVDSLLAYWEKHADEASEVYADRRQHTITAILDAHYGIAAAADEFRPRWQTHEAVLTLTHSDALTAWLDRNDKLSDQVGFAEFCEDWMGYIISPDAADLVEMAQHFQATTKATFKSGFKLVNGQRQLEHTEQVDASSNIRGESMLIPTTMTLRLPIWRGATTAEELTARIRYRVNHNGPGQLGIGYKLDRPTEVIDAAFESEIARVETHVNRPVLRGMAADA